MAERHRMSIDSLVESVWGENSPPTAVKQVRNAISDLRRALLPTGATIGPTSNGYSLDLSGARYDLVVFRQYVGDGMRLLAERRDRDAVIMLRKALALWNGPALAGLDNQLLAAKAAALQDERLSVFEICVDLELDQGYNPALLGELGRWVADNPFRERLAAQLIAGLFRSGARDRALAAYERTRRHLADGLGLDPGPELQALHREMLAAGRAVTGARPGLTARLGRSNLPPDSRHFIGRDRVLADLLWQARHGSPAGQPASYGGQALVIGGMAGTGKTALAVHAAYRLAEDFPDGQFFLDLHGHCLEDEPLDAGTVLQSMLRLAAVPAERIPASAEERAHLWQQLLRDRRVLMVLDDVLSSQQIQLLLANSPQALLIVTSRRRLASLPASRIYSLDGLPSAEARSLFHELAADRELYDEPESVDRILEYCQRLPLAISAAASKLRHRPNWPASYLAGRLADPEQRLVELRTEDHGLAERLEASYRKLTGEQQRLLQMLALDEYHDIVPARAAELAEVSLSRAGQLLEDLVDGYLLDEPVPGRYRMRSLLQSFCAVKAQAPKRPVRLQPVLPHTVPVSPAC
jgi:DNA-binding SARP family transcriptional activator